MQRNGVGVGLIFLPESGREHSFVLLTPAVWVVGDFQ